MKLKRLFLASLGLGALIACSDDQSEIDSSAYQQIEARLSITATAKDKVTKTVTTEDPEAGTRNEQAIKSLTAIAFYEDGTYANMKTVERDGIDKVEDLVVKVKALKAGDVSETKLKVVLLANRWDITAPASLAGLKESTMHNLENYTFDGVNSTKQSQYLPMSSPILEVTGLVAGTEYDNWIEKDNNVVPVKNANNMKVTISSDKVTETTEFYSTSEDDKIPLQRYLARIQLEKISTKFTGHQMSFTLTKVSVANASNYSLYYGADGSQNGLQYVNGANESGGYEDTPMPAFYRGYPATIDRKDYYLAQGRLLSSLCKNYTGIPLSETPTTFKDATISTSQGSYPMAQFYVFEFDSYAIGKVDADGNAATPVNGTNEIYTTLIITGNLKAGSIDKGERSFRIPIRHSDTDFGVKRNYIYKVEAVLTGEGSENPDETLLNANVSFTVKVVDWNVIKQVEDDVN